jgi:hypothetical protein
MASRPVLDLGFPGRVIDGMGFARERSFVPYPPRSICASRILTNESG